MDISIFLSPETWVSFITLLFLEIILGIDNLVFITITCNKLPASKEHIGRKLGLAGAFISRCVFLCFASWLVHMSSDLFTLPFGRHIGISVRDIILIVGGIYLIYKGISELMDVVNLKEERAEVAGAFESTEVAEVAAVAGLAKDAKGTKATKANTNKTHSETHKISLPQAIATIMIMDIVFSIDSVITAVGLAELLFVMVAAVLVAIVLMMIFVDPISNFINKNVEMKILALMFIALIGILLTLDGLDITSGIEVFDMHAEKVMVYFAMLFSFLATLVQMKRKSNYEAFMRNECKNTNSNVGSKASNSARKEQN